MKPNSNNSVQQILKVLLLEVFAPFNDSKITNSIIENQGVNLMFTGRLIIIFRKYWNSTITIRTIFKRKLKLGSIDSSKLNYITW